MKINELPDWLLDAPAGLEGLVGTYRSDSNVLDLSVLSRRYVALVCDEQYQTRWLAGVTDSASLFILNDRLTLQWVYDTDTERYIYVRTQHSVSESDDPVYPEHDYIVPERPDMAVVFGNTVNDLPYDIDELTIGETE